MALLFLLFYEDVYSPSSGWIVFWARLVLASMILIIFLGYFGEEAASLRKSDDLEQVFYILKMVLFSVGLYMVVLRLTGLKIKDFLN